MLRTYAAPLASLLAACGAPEAERFLIYDVDPATHAYALLPAVISTLDDPSQGRGAVARLRGGGSLVASLAPADTEAAIEDALSIDGGQTPDIQYTVDEDGVGVPWDFDSAVMLSLYHHLERASEFFTRAGVPVARVRRLDAYYSADIDIPFLPQPAPLITDNAAYVMTLDVFFVPPRVLLDDVPLVANRGVVVHEYSHAVFNRLVHEDDRVPSYLFEEWPERALNELRSLDEGVADVFAALATSDPDFIAPSIDGDLFDVDRNLAVDRRYTAELRAEVNTAALVEYDPYELGSVIASTFWALREHLTDDVLAQTLVTALDGLPVPDASFSLAQVCTAFIALVDPTARPAVCAKVQERMEAIAAEISCSP